ncbi:hypothetical protein DICVIV_12840 [Dictyocaulus viviparus]|uniref:Uncharacterized protein n=1 Tax=Dictyocaulus viviparus TaxID=29172 RepID=A0A0D8XFQ2_DICVI|nr:hypothetical protein DICVIV_12840 [Dictyocaulus viviparus]
MYNFIDLFRYSQNLLISVVLYRGVSCQFIIYILVHVFLLPKNSGSKFRLNHHSFRWSSTCSVWQSALIVLCIAATLLFTAFDHDVEPEKMAQKLVYRITLFYSYFKCSILMALRDRDLTFCLLTLLIFLHATAAVIISLSARRQMNMYAATCMTISLKNVIATEAVMWHFSLFMSGCFVVYRHVATQICDECIFIALEMSFIILPLAIAFLHPMLTIWFVFPMRDAAIRVYPCLRSILPEYAMVPPPPILHNSCEKTNMIVHATLNQHHTQPTGVVIEKADEQPGSSSQLNKNIL